ncbi:MAG: neutral zinc metallopeptidase, partial [Nitrososphaeraceae archaeon]
MRWQGRRASTNVEDRRGRVVKGAVGGGVGGGILVLVIMLVLNFCGGGDLSQIPIDTQLTSSAVTT